jgi:heme-degrading monooxygenase HmoA
VTPRSNRRLRDESPGKRETSFVIVWEFYVRSSKRRAFERAYGPDGDWANFFRTGTGYIRTDLVRDRNSPDRYLTLDYWKSRGHYEKFRKKNQKTYLARDHECETLTSKETRIGEFGIKW